MTFEWLSFKITLSAKLSISCLYILSLENIDHSIIHHDVNGEDNSYAEMSASVGKNYRHLGRLCLNYRHLPPNNTRSSHLANQSQKG